MIEVGIAFFVVAMLIVVIWVLIEFKRVRHKVFALFLIGLVLFLYLSVSFVFKDKDFDFRTVEGITDASGVYFSWLGSIFGNLKTITINAVKMNWDNLEADNSTG